MFPHTIETDGTAGYFVWLSCLADSFVRLSRLFHRAYLGGGHGAMSTPSGLPIFFCM